ncbi:MAG: DMT family transporter [Azospirillaceae bacterium]
MTTDAIDTMTASEKAPAPGAERPALRALGPLRTGGAIAFTVMLWASAFVGVRGTVTVFPPGELALLRFLVASAALVLVAAATRMALPAWRDWPYLGLVGLFGVTAYNLGLNFGSTVMEAGAAAFLVNTVPIWTALIAAAVLGERLRPLGWAGIAVAFAGSMAILLGAGRSLSLQPAALAVLGAAVAQALYFILQKPVLRRYTPLQVVCVSTWIGTAAMVPAGLGLPTTLAEAPPVATAVVVYLGLMPGAVAFLLWSYVLARVPAGRASSFLYLVPPTAVAIGWVALAEVPAPLALAGGAAALGGVILVNTKGRRA